MEIYKEFMIEAAHLLPNVPLDHKCRHLHGHSFKIRIGVSGPVDKSMGWIIDFDHITRAFKPIHQRLDHRYLNEIAGLANPTSENLASWIWNELKTNLSGLSYVEVAETCTSGCRYQGELLS